jgi:hypothetical protein
MKACNAFTDNPSQYQLLDPRDVSWFIQSHQAITLIIFTEIFFHSISIW